MSSRTRFTAPVVLAVAAAIVPAAYADWGQANADASQDSFAAVTVDTTPSPGVFGGGASIG
jgi:hypothetical protein